MRFGKWRGSAVAVALAFLIVAGRIDSARASGFTRTIPREGVAVDVTTGGPYFAPPVPYGHYAKDCLGSIQEACGLVKGSVFGLFHKVCGACGGAGCGLCGGGNGGNG